MANPIPGHIEFAGDYSLDSVILHTHFGEKVDIKKVMIELNIFESIYRNALTGSVVIGDAQNLIGKLELNGTERISFKLSTPGVESSPSATNVNRSIVDASLETGHPFHVYKISDRQQINPNTTVYTLHFGSRELMRNQRTKVSQAYDGRLDTAVLKILMNKDYIDTKKEISIEPTGNSDKIVVPNMRPYDAINMIARKSLAQKSGAVGYYFYETPKGIYFRSWDNMVTVKGSYDRPIKQEFYYMPMNINDETIRNKINHDFKSVKSYSFVNNFHDVLANTALGTYGHNVITHNLYDKSYKKSSYNYANEFGNSKHTDLANEKSYRERYAIAADSRVDEDDKKISDYNESRVSLQSTTQFLHDKNTGAGYGLDVQQDGSKLVQSVSQRNQVKHGTTLKLVINGQSYLEVGDLIKFNLLKVQPKNELLGEHDKQYSGKYVITKIRHQILSEGYTMALECAKDSVRYGFQQNDFKIEKNPNLPSLRDTYEKEEPDTPNRHA
jgi:hypothetical protein